MMNLFITQYISVVMYFVVSSAKKRKKESKNSGRVYGKPNNVLRLTVLFFNVSEMFKHPPPHTKGMSNDSNTPKELLK